jgi:TfoX/Sxy family transcriptional regulator of competence genes
MAYDAATAERVRKLLAGRAHVVERNMMGGLCFMVNGSMCCSVSGRGGLLIRINPEAQARLVREPHVTPMQMGARTMRGFVRIAPEGYRTDTALAQWVGRGIASIGKSASTRRRHASRAQGQGAAKDKAKGKRR